MPTLSAILPLSLKPPPLAFGDVDVKENVAMSGMAVVGEDEEQGVKEGLAVVMLLAVLANRTQ